MSKQGLTQSDSSRLRLEQEAAWHISSSFPADSTKKEGEQRYKRRQRLLEFFC